MKELYVSTSYLNSKKGQGTLIPPYFVNIKWVKKNTGVEKIVIELTLGLLGWTV
jgi:hypothetical protein